MRLTCQTWTLFAFSAAAASVVVHLLAPSLSIWVAVGSLVMLAVLRPRDKTDGPADASSGAPSLDVDTNRAVTRDQLIAVVRDLSRALEVSETARRQMHDVRNAISPLILDVDGVGELPPGGPRESMWAELQADVCETLGALHAQLQADGPFSVPKTPAPIGDALESASATTLMNIERPDKDARVFVDGGAQGLTDVFSLFIADAVQRGATTFRVDVETTSKSAAIAMTDDGPSPSATNVARQAAKARALLSGGEVESSVEAQPFVLKLRLAQSSRGSGRSPSQPFASEPVVVNAPAT